MVRAISKEGLVKEKANVRVKAVVKVSLKVEARKAASSEAAKAKASLEAAKVKAKLPVTKEVNRMTVGIGRSPAGTATGSGSSSGPNRIGSQKQKQTHSATLFKDANHVSQDADIFHGFLPDTKIVTRLV